MATCPLTLTGIDYGCKTSIGGIAKLYVSLYPMQTIEGNPTFYGYTELAFPKQTSGFTTTKNVNEQNQTIVYQGEITYVSNKLDSTKRTAIEALVKSNTLYAVIIDNNGVYHYFNELTASAKIDSGVNYGDGSKITLSLTREYNTPINTLTTIQMLQTVVDGLIFPISSNKTITYTPTTATAKLVLADGTVYTGVNGTITFGSASQQVGVILADKDTTLISLSGNLITGNIDFTTTLQELDLSDTALTTQMADYILTNIIAKGEVSGTHIINFENIASEPTLALVTEAEGLGWTIPF